MLSVSTVPIGNPIVEYSPRSNGPLILLQDPGFWGLVPSSGRLGMQSSARYRVSLMDSTSLQPNRSISNPGGGGGGGVVGDCSSMQQVFSSTTFSFMRNVSALPPGHVGLVVVAVTAIEHSGHGLHVPSGKQEYPAEAQHCEFRQYPLQRSTVVGSRKLDR